MWVEGLDIGKIRILFMKISSVAPTQTLETTLNMWDPKHEFTTYEYLVTPAFQADSNYS